MSQAAILYSALLIFPALAVYYLSRRDNGRRTKDNGAEGSGFGSAPQISPDAFTPFKLVRKEHITHNTSLYRFSLPDSTRPLGLQPGQHIQIHTLIKDPATEQPQEVVKPYTPVSPFHLPGHFDLLIKTYAQGRISRYMDSVPVGGKVEMRGPKGTFRFPHDLRPQLGMIAGGTGITPLLSICRAILEPDEGSGISGCDFNTSDYDISMIFANRTPGDCLLESELAALEAQHPEHFRLHWTVDTPDEKWTGGQGLVTPAMIKEHLPDPSADCRILICGPPPMMTMVRDGLLSCGYTEDKIFKF